MYLELKPELLIYDQTKNEEKIRKLKEANIQLADQDQRIREQEAMIKQLKRDQSDLEKLKDEVLQLVKKEYQNLLLHQLPLCLCLPLFLIF